MSSRRGGGSPKIQNIFSASNIRRVTNPEEEIDYTKDILVVTKPWGADTTSRSRLQEEQYGITLAELVEGFYKTGQITEVIVSPDVDENVLEVRVEPDTGSINYRLSASIGGVPLDQYISETFLTINETLTEEITSNGVGTVGGISEGFTFPAGMSFVDFVKSIFQKAIPASYSQSSASLGTSQSTVVEVGQFYSPPLTISYNQRDSGVATEGEFFINGISVDVQATSQSSYSYTPAAIKLTAEGASMSYRGEVNHAQGPQKQDNFGNDSGDPAVLVPARNNLSTNTITVIARRRLFYGIDKVTPTNSTEVRSLGDSQYATDNTFSITVPIGTISVGFAIPSHKTLSQVLFVGALTNDETGNFLPTETIVATSGQDVGQDMDNYKVYMYVPTVPFSSNVRYDVTLS